MASSSLLLSGMVWLMVVLMRLSDWVGTVMMNQVRLVGCFRSLDLLPPSDLVSISCHVITYLYIRFCTFVSKWKDVHVIWKLDRLLHLTEVLTGINNCLR